MVKQRLPKKTKINKIKYLHDNRWYPTGGEHSRSRSLSYPLCIGFSPTRETEHHPGKPAPRPCMPRSRPASYLQQLSRIYKVPSISPPEDAKPECRKNIRNMNRELSITVLEPILNSCCVLFNL